MKASSIWQTPTLVIELGNERKYREQLYEDANECDILRVSQYKYLMVM